MDEMARRYEEWKDRNPFMRNKSTRQEFTSKLGLPVERLVALEMGAELSPDEKKNIRGRGGPDIVAEWEAWMLTRPTGHRVLPPQD